MKDILKKLVAQGLDAYQVTLQEITCRDGSTIWAYSTMRSQTRANFFGNNAVNATCSVRDSSTPRTNNTYSTKLVTVWLPECDAETAELYRSTCGATAVAIVGQDGAVDLHTLADASALLPQDVPASVQPSV